MTFDTVLTPTAPTSEAVLLYSVSAVGCGGMGVVAQNWDKKQGSNIRDDCMASMA